MVQVSQAAKLAIDGGAPVITAPLPPMYPGGMRIGQEEEEAVLSVLRSKRLFRYYGPEPGPSRVAELEAAFAAMVGVKHCAAVSSGSASLMAALAGLGVGPGDDVLVPAYTWIATASAIIALGAVPILVEVDESLTIDAADAEQKITPYTKALMAVHMRGAPCQMDALLDVAARHNIGIIEDVAQANGGSYQGRRLGGIGNVGAFSLQFNKILTSGEGGLVTTNDDDTHRRVVMYTDVVGGQRAGGPAAEILPGINLRLAELQGAVALVQLGRLEGLLAAMRQRKAEVKEGISDVASREGVTFRTLNDPQGDASIALIFYLPTPDRARYVTEALRAEGVGAGHLYSPDKPDNHIYAHWTPILQQRTWSANGGPWRWHEGSVSYEADACPRTLDLLGRAVNVDISPDLSDQNVTEMVDAINKVLASV